MELNSVFLRDYKSFSNEHILELRPLTILIGRNSSGKSALARSPLLLCHALSNKAQAPLDLNVNDLSFAGSFRDFIHGRFEHGSVALGGVFKANGLSTTIRGDVQNISELRLQLVSYFEISEGDDISYAFKWKELENELQTSSRSYECSGDYEGTIKVEFNGFTPTIQGMDDKNKQNIDQIFEKISPFVEQVTHLGPFRESPKRQYAFRGTTPIDIGQGKGQFAPEVLGMDHVQRGGILPDVSEWFKQHLGDWSLGVKEHGDTFSIHLTNQKRSPDALINLMDVGQGMSQVLPIVVQRFMNNPQLIEVVEQPELHLHPAAHGAIADLYIDTLRSNSRFIIETHSENFILRVRRRIAEEKLDPKDVIIHSIDDSGENTQILKIEIEDDGSVTNWPDGIFSEDFHEVNAILNPKKD